MKTKEALLRYLYEVIGEEGCGVACSDADIFYDEQNGWQMMLEGFMEPWKLGHTMDEAKGQIREYATMGFGLH